MGERLGPRKVATRTFVAVVCKIGELSKSLGITSIGMVSGSIFLELYLGDLRSTSLRCECAETFCHSLNNESLACQRSPHVVSAVKTDQRTSPMLAVMALPSFVVFWYVDLFRDAEHGGFEAVQRVSPGLLG